MSALAFHSFPRISFRTWARGGAASETPRLTPADVLVSKDAFILLVHGYNVVEDSAFDDYRKFLSTLGAPWSEMAVGVYWPGDSWVSDPSIREGWTYWITRYPSYLWQPKRARVIGRAIADRLARAVDNRKLVAFERAKSAAAQAGTPTPVFDSIEPPALTVHIVAHSMGCRLALELLDRLESNLTRPGQGRDQANRCRPKPVQVKLVALMAAAVPRYLVGDGGERQAGLTTAQALRVFRSSRDGVLLGAFPLGQSFESDEPHLPFSGKRSAIGRAGLPGGPTLEDERIGHGGYWKSTSIPPTLARDLAKFHPELSNRRAVQARGPQTRSALSGRSTGERQLGSRGLA